MSVRCLELCREVWPLDKVFIAGFVDISLMYFFENSCLCAISTAFVKSSSFSRNSHSFRLSSSNPKTNLSRSISSRTAAGQSSLLYSQASTLILSLVKYLSINSPSGSKSRDTRTNCFFVAHNMLGML